MQGALAHDSNANLFVLRRACGAILATKGVTCFSAMLIVALFLSIDGFPYCQFWATVVHELRGKLAQRAYVMHILHT